MVLSGGLIRSNYRGFAYRCLSFTGEGWVRRMMVAAMAQVAHPAMDSRSSYPRSMANLSSMTDQEAVPGRASQQHPHS
jgi:hypothetical protein